MRTKFTNHQNKKTRLRQAIALVIALLLACTMTVHGADRYAVANGNWNATSTWSATSGGPSGASVPVAGDNVFIGEGATARTVTVTATAACANITIGKASGITGVLTLSVSGGTTLTVSGNITINTTGSFTVTNVSIDNQHTLNIGGNLTVDGLFNVTTANDDAASVVFNGLGAQTISGSGATCTFFALTINNPVGVTLQRDIVIAQTPSSTSANLTLGTNAIFDLSTFKANRSTSGGTLTLNAGSRLKLSGSSGGQAGSNFPTNLTPSLNATSTVEYAGAGQTVYNISYPGNLVLSGSGLKTFSAATTIGGNLSISNSVQASLAGSTLSSASSLTLNNGGTPSGTWGSSGSTATYQNDTYFGATSGRITVGSNTCSSIAFTTNKSDLKCFQDPSGGSISVSNVTGGTSPYMYSIHNGGATYQPGNSFGSLPVGSYQVRIKDANQCESKPVQ